MARPVALKRLYPAIGEFLIQYAIVQGTLRTLLLALLGVRGKGATTLIYGMSDEVIARKIRIALRAYGRHFHKFQPALERLDGVTTFRNQLIHWVPFVNSSKTTIDAFVDAYRDYKNPSQPRINCTPTRLRKLSDWLQLLEWDLVTLLLAIDRKTRFDIDDYRTLQPGFEPDVPKSSYPPKASAIVL